MAWTGCVRKEPSRKIECLLERAPRQKGGEAEERPQGDSKAVWYLRDRNNVLSGARIVRAGEVGTKPHEFRAWIGLRLSTEVPLKRC